MAFDQIPLNAYAWTMGGIALFFFALRSYRNHQETKNPVAWMYFLLGAPIAVAFFLYGIPPMLSKDPDVVIQTYYLADMFVMISMIAQSRLMWFIGLKNRIRYAWVALPTIMLTLTILLLEFGTSKAAFGNNLTLYTDIEPVLYAKSLLYLLICFPIGYFFIHQGALNPETRAKAKSIITGVAFILVSAAAISSSLLQQGSDTHESAISNFFVFLLFLIINTLPRKKLLTAAATPPDTTTNQRSS
ncbi:MAG TPA: hypothetical protein VNA68_03000 [Candidatus Dormibacteraeota bacterium]|nr:hypothetical protein [Candidatus Dormibacteraeota bacterium]